MGEKIYFDTNQIYYIRRIAEEAKGYDFGDYSWAYKQFKDDSRMINDIKALCYIVSLQYQWDLEFSPSNEAYYELSKSLGKLAERTREVWEVFVENQTEEGMKHTTPIDGNTKKEKLINLDGSCNNFRFIDDIEDREIICGFINSSADVMLTSDDDILRHRNKLDKLGIKVKRPYEWISDFLKDARGNEDAIDFIERILFMVGGSEK
jgi:predicted nucleic acid-binding protein